MWSYCHLCWWLALVQRGTGKLRGWEPLDRGLSPDHDGDDDDEEEENGGDDGDDEDGEPVRVGSGTVCQGVPLLLGSG